MSKRETGKIQGEREAGGGPAQGDVILCALLCAAALLLMRSVRPDQTLFGSTTDWLSQHAVFPEYFRQQFLQTGSLFPDFAAELGGGQNIYNFAYYGLFSPFVLCSYLFPQIPMEQWLEAVSAGGTVISAGLFFLWMRGRSAAPWAAFASSLCFLCAAPLIFHAHRQIMFVSYMPFLILAFIAADRCPKAGWHAVFCASVLGCILTSYFFSVGCLAALALYTVSETENTPCKNRREKCMGLLAGACIAVLMAGILWVPAGLALLSGRSGNIPAMETGDILLSILETAKRFLPAPEPQWLLGGSYTLGLTWIALPALLAGLWFRTGRKKLLPAGLILLVTVPGLVWLLNGTLYTRPKALIPFLPLYCLMTAELLQRTACWLRKKGKTESAGRTAARKVCALLLFLTVVIPPPVKCDAANQGEDWVSADRWDRLRLQAKESLLESRMDDLQARCDDLSGGSAAVNQTFGRSALRTSVYSSVYNQDYSRFCGELCQNAVPVRNAMMNVSTENLFFQAFMGVRYLISAGGVPAGYEKIAEREELSLYENRRVLPLGWAMAETADREEVEKMELPQRLQTLFQRIITETGDGAENLPKEQGEEGWFHQMTAAERKELLGAEGFPAVRCGETVTAPFQKPLRETILLVEFDVEDKGTPKNQDISITINGITNKLSKKNALYPNGNTHFCYVLSSGAPLDGLTVKFGEGRYDISGLKMAVMDERLLWAATDKPDPFEVRREQWGTNRISGRIRVSENGWFATSIPYDRGFTVTVDGDAREYHRVNCAFLGFPIEKGLHEIAVTYRPPGKTLGMMVSLCGFSLGGLALVSHFLSFRRRNHNALSLVETTGDMYNDRNDRMAEKSEKKGDSL